MQCAWSNARCRKPRPFPPERLESWRDALLEEIGRGRCVGSRGRFNPRGDKRKMSNFNVRRRGAALHRWHQPTRVLRI
jgi:hypothetical protein